MSNYLVDFLIPHPSRPNLPLLIYLPGLDGSGQLLQVQLMSLRKSFDVRCLSIHPHNAAGWSELAQRVVQVVKQEQTVDPVRSIVLCGESFGGCLAMQVAAIAPELFQSLVLVNPASSFSRRPWLNWGGQFGRWLPESVYQTASIAFLPLLVAFDRVTPLDRQVWAQVVRSVPAQTFSRRIEMLGNFQTPAMQLQKFSQPVLIIASGRDQLLPSLAEAYRLKGIFPQAQVAELPQSGHACLLESAVNLQEILRTHDVLKCANPI